MLIMKWHGACLFPHTGNRSTQATFQIDGVVWCAKHADFGGTQVLVARSHGLSQGAIPSRGDRSAHRCRETKMP